MVLSKRSRAAALMLSLVLALSLAQQTAHAGWHVVQAEETLAGIAAQYGVTTAELADANGIINPNLIHVGAELWIPESGEETGGESIFYTVEPGDTLANIASAHGVDTFALALLNGIEAPWTIFPGQVLVIPVTGAGAVPVPAVPDTINEDVPYYDMGTVRWMIVETSRAYGWDPYLILSLAWRESTWDQRAISSSGAVGVFQLMPATAEWAGPYLLGREIDYVNDAWDNIEAGVAYLTHLRELTGSDYLALASYFQGSGSVERDGIFTPTRDYALGIIESRDLFADGRLP